MVNCITCRSVSDPWTAGAKARRGLTTFMNSPSYSPGYGENRPGDLQPSLSLRDRPASRLVPAREASYSLVDINGHVNNARYIAWAMEAIPEDVVKPTKQKSGPKPKQTTNRNP